ncbi:MAG TPA: DUF488 domain-containing protein [Actinomycetota bacterium]
MRIWTIGHSNRPLEEFVGLLEAHGITRLVDVRTVPRSRHNPQFNLDSLPAELAARGIGHRHMPELGGLRKPRPDSPNQGWRNESFRGYADHVQTEEFQRSLDALVELAGRQPTACMCAEAVPWRCHRSLIADALVVRGHRVFHIMSSTKADPHELNPMAVVRDGRITYPGPQQLSLE